MVFPNEDNAERVRKPVTYSVGSEMGCILRLENHYQSPWMGAIRTLAVYIAMTFLRRIVMLSRSRKCGRCAEARWLNCALGTIQASIALLVLLSLVHPSRA